MKKKQYDTKEPANRDTTARKERLRELCKSYNLKIEFKEAALVYIFNADGDKVALWGLWCVEEFMKGYKFAIEPRPIAPGPGKWKSSSANSSSTGLGSS